MKINKLSQDERDIVINEMARRVKDVIFMEAENAVRKELERIGDNELNPNDSIIFNYTVDTLFFDILQIVGRIRRSEIEPY
jgi:hypothetical protein